MNLSVNPLHAGFRKPPVIICAITLTASMAFAWQQNPAQNATPGQGRGVVRGRGLQPDPLHPVLPIGSPAPDFNLPGIDGKSHTLNEYASAKILAIVFESNHCPVSQLYEGRIKQIHDIYKDQGLIVVGINPNNPKAVRINELDHTDMGDSLPEMKLRAEYRHFNWPYLYDGETQATAAMLRAVSTPYTFLSSIRIANCVTRDASTTTCSHPRRPPTRLGTQSMPCWRASQSRPRPRGLSVVPRSGFPNRATSKPNGRRFWRSR